ncbi:hypothetical protein WMF45_34710 [Sorangium sp. So ce448]|uniref:hypothetical protein n=1 Tax=Sorangium sp. So ce448 TaxID=3133314 RepID=UPI003F6235A7
MDVEESLRALRERIVRAEGKPESEEARARWEASLKRAVAFMSTFYGVLGIATALAAPRALAKGTMDDFKAMTQERVLGLLDDYFAMIDAYKAGESEDIVPEMLQHEASVRMFRALLATWQFGPVAPEPLVRLAREILSKIFRIDVSDEELDRWEGPSDPAPSGDAASGAGGE